MSKEKVPKKPLTPVSRDHADALGLQLRYFVLNPHKRSRHGKASRAAIRRYASIMDRAEDGGNPVLAADLRLWMDELDMQIIKSLSPDLSEDQLASKVYLERTEGE